MVWYSHLFKNFPQFVVIHTVKGFGFLIRENMRQEIPRGQRSPLGSEGKVSATMWEARVRSLSREDPLEKEMATTPVLLPGKSHGLRSLVGYSPWGRKESDTTERLHFTVQEP